MDDLERARRTGERRNGSDPWAQPASPASSPFKLRAILAPSASSLRAAMWTPLPRRMWTRSSRSPILKTRFARHISAEAATGIDLVVDYLWGRPTELLLEALGHRLQSQSHSQNPRWWRWAKAQATPSRSPARSCAASISRCSAADSAQPRLTASSPPFQTLFSLAAAGTLKIDVEPVPLADVESAWNRVEKGRRIVFTP